MSVPKQFHDLPENLHSGVVEIGNQPTPTAQPHEPLDSTQQWQAVMQGDKFIQESPTPAHVEQPASEGGGARYGYMHHVGNWQCIRCEHQVPYDPNWSVMAEAIGKHYAEAHYTPPATGEAATHECNSDCGYFPCPKMPWSMKPPAPVGDVEQAELPPLDVTDDEMRRAKYVLVGIGEDCAKAERFCRERQLRAALQMERSYLKSWQDEIAAHKATRERLYDKLQEVAKQMNEQEAELMSRVRTAEADNQELRRKVEEVVADFISVPRYSMNLHTNCSVPNLSGNWVEHADVRKIVALLRLSAKDSK